MRKTPSIGRPGLAAAMLIVLILAVQARTQPADAGISAAGTSTVYVCNLDASQAATVVMDVYRQNSGLEMTLNLPVVPALGVAEAALSLSPLPTGAFAGVVSSDRSIGAVTLQRWPTSGGSLLSSSPGAGTEVWVPQILRDSAGRSSLVSVQNTDAGASATVEVGVLDAAGVTVANQSYMIPPGTSITLDISQDLEWMVLPPGFGGSARIRSATDVVVDHYVDFAASSRGVNASAGLAPDDVGTTVAAPVTMNSASLGMGAPELSSSIAVAVTGAASADVTVDYTGVSAGCAGQAYQDVAAAVAPGGLAVFNQADGNLPAGCVATATVSSTEPLAAVVTVSDAAQQLAASYEAVPVAQASAIHVLPRFHRAADGLTTGLVVSNPSGAAANFAYTLWDTTGNEIPCAGCAGTVPAGGGTAIWMADVAAIQDGTAGHLVLQSDQPVLATALDVPVGQPWDLAAARLCSAVAGPPLGAAREWLPFLVNAGGGGPGPATMTPFPTPTVAITATLPATPTPLLPATSTPLPTETPVPVDTATPMPTAVPGSGGPHPVRGLAGRAPTAAIAAALADPGRVYGWGMPRNPNIPYHPIFNPYRTCLQLRNMGVPFHPMWNPLVFTAGC